MDCWKHGAGDMACSIDAERKIQQLEQDLQEKESEIIRLREQIKEDENNRRPVFKLSHEEIQRYGRQLILPEIGMRGQLCLRNESVLIVGGGGLGCPAAVYLAAAGVGYIGIIDYDEVEMNNLHRQILHTESRIGMKKTSSLAEGVHRLNSSVKCELFDVQLTRFNANDIISKYNIVVDATDNVATRYLINDACVFNGKPLVSGSALKFEGQLTVYNYKDAPCYRCLHPEPPPPETVGNCSDAGVLGVVPGIIGCLQALEVIKISIGTDVEGILCRKLLIFDGLSGQFRTVRLRTRQPSCVVCGQNPTVTSLIDYEQFCGSCADDKHKPQKLLPESDRITVSEYADILNDKNKEHILIDVRLPVEQDICSFHNAINIPFSKIQDEDSLATIQRHLKNTYPVYVICRNGNDSQKAVKILCEKLSASATIKDIVGGTNEWARKIDDGFPCY